MKRHGFSNDLKEFLYTSSLKHIGTHVHTHSQTHSHSQMHTDRIHREETKNPQKLGLHSTLLGTVGKG